MLFVFRLTNARPRAVPHRTDVSSVDAVSEAFKLPAVFMFRAAYHGQPPEKQQKILQVRYSTYARTRITRARTARTPNLVPL